MYFVELFIKKGAISMATRKTAKRVRGRRGLAVRFLLIALAIFLFLKAVQLYGQIREKRLEMDKLDAEIRTQGVVNEGLADQDANADDHREQAAHEDGYYYSGQQIYQSE